MTPGRYQPRSRNKGAELIFACCEISAGAAVLATSTTAGGLITWTKTGTGAYTATFAEGVPSGAAVAVTATLKAATAVDLVPQVVSNDLVTAKTVVIRLNAAAVATDPAAACTLCMLVAVENTSL
jgi:hypothetical protein